MDPLIIDRGRGPEIAGTRITVYDILDYADWDPKSVALWFNLSTDQVLAARRYIDEHRDEVMAEYQEMLDRDAQGNPPEIEAKRQASHAKLLAYVEKLRQGNNHEAAHGGHPGGP